MPELLRKKRAFELFERYEGNPILTPEKWPSCQRCYEPRRDQVEWRDFAFSSCRGHERFFPFNCRSQQ